MRRNRLGGGIGDEQWCSVYYISRFVMGSVYVYTCLLSSLLSCFEEYINAWGCALLLEDAAHHQHTLFLAVSGRHAFEQPWLQPYQRWLLCVRVLGRRVGLGEKGDKLLRGRASHRREHDMVLFLSEWHHQFREGSGQAENTLINPIFS